MGKIGDARVRSHALVPHNDGAGCPVHAARKVERADVVVQKREKVGTLRGVKALNVPSNCGVDIEDRLLCDGVFNHQGMDGVDGLLERSLLTNACNLADTGAGMEEVQPFQRL